MLFVRHGATPTTGRTLPGRAPGLHLSDAGRAQAERLAERFGSLPAAPTAVYASPLERTRETAAPLARALGLRVRSARGLVEADIGTWTEKSLRRTMRAREWPAVQRFPSGFRFPGGESFTEIAARATAEVMGLVDRHRGETIVAVSHADVIRVVVATAAGVPLDLMQRLMISTCSVSAVSYLADGARVLCMNASAEALVPA